MIDYSVVEFKKFQDITIQLKFDEPLNVSYFGKTPETMDFLEVSLNNPMIFIDPATKEPI